MIKPILRRTRVEALTGLKSSALYEHIQKKILPPGINIGPRAVGWPEHEIEAVINARIAGKSETQIRDLVATLVAARQQAA